MRKVNEDAWRRAGQRILEQRGVEFEQADTEWKALLADQAGSLTEDLSTHPVDVRYRRALARYNAAIDAACFTTASSSSRDTNLYAAGDIPIRGVDARVSVGVVHERNSLGETTRIESVSSPYHTTNLKNLLPYPPSLLITAIRLQRRVAEAGAITRPAA